MQVKFTGTYNITVPASKRVSLKRFEELPEILNPAIAKIEKLLKKQKIRYMKTDGFNKKGKMTVTITTVLE